MFAHGREPVSAQCLEPLWTPTGEPVECLVNVPVVP